MMQKLASRTEMTPLFFDHILTNWLFCTSNVHYLN